MDHQRLSRHHEVGCQPPDPFTFPDSCVGALIERRVMTLCWCRGTAVGTVEEPVGSQLVEIAADGFRGDLETIRQFGHPHMWPQAELKQNLPSPFVLSKPAPRFEIVAR